MQQMNASFEIIINALNVITILFKKTESDGYYLI